MEKILIYIKHHLGFLWKIIEYGNSVLFSLFYKGRMELAISEVLNEFSNSSYSYRRLEEPDSDALFMLIKSQSYSDLEFFSPHRFDLNSIKKQFKKPSFLVLGVFDQGILVGYFFLRFFMDKKCFVGRLLDKGYRGKGIGNNMNLIMYNTAWRMRFRCLSTISRDNDFIMSAHSKNENIRIIKELDHNYLLVEFVN